MAGVLLCVSESSWRLEGKTDLKQNEIHIEIWRRVLVNGGIDMINCSGEGVPRYLCFLLCFLFVNSVEDSCCFHYSKCVPSYVDLVAPTQSRILRYCNTCNSGAWVTPTPGATRSSKYVALYWRRSKRWSWLPLDVSVSFGLYTWGILGLGFRRGNSWYVCYVYNSVKKYAASYWKNNH